MRYLFLALAGLLTAGLAAQTADSATVSRFQVGVTGGYAEHEIDFTPSADVERLGGNQFGVAVRYFDHPWIGVQAELNYQEAGWREDLGEDFTTLYERRTRYVEFVALTQTSFGRGVFQPLLQVGPYLAVPLGEEEDIPDGFVPPDTPLPTYIGREIDFRLNYGLRAGAGFNLEIGGLTIQAEGFYLLGFNDIIRTGETTAAISRRTGVGGRAAIFYTLF